jgi:hypothetical protein
VTYILLTGAGFTFNWGGLLASDMFSRLLGSALLDDPLRQMLWKNRENSGGFEDVLAAPLPLAREKTQRVRATEPLFC